MTAINPAISDFIRANGLDTLDGAFAFEGGVDLIKPGLGNRRRTRIDLPDAPSLFLKRYYPMPLGKRLRTLLSPRKWRCEAMIEHTNILAITAAGVETMHALAAGVEGNLFTGRRSYTLVDAVAGETLETATAALLPDRAEELTAALVLLAKTLHHAGFVHRDFYLCHIFADITPDEIRLSLIDLARVIRPLPARGFRWRVKDLAQLYYSSPQAWIDTQWPAFLSAYLDAPVEGAMVAKWNCAIESKAARIARHDKNRYAKLVAQRDANS